MTIPPVAAPYLAAVLLLGEAGLAKIARPHGTAVALRRAGFGLRLRRTEALVRLGATAEVAVAGAAVVVPGAVPAVAVAVSYLGFATFVAAALLRHWPIASCGCLGRPDTVPTTAHLAVNAAAVLAATWWAAGSHRAVMAALRHHPGSAMPVIVTTVVCDLLAIVVLTNPRAQARHRAGRGVGGRPRWPQR